MEKRYQLHNTAKDPKHKLQRALRPTTARNNILLAGGTIRVGRSTNTVIHEVFLMRNRAEIREFCRDGILELYSMSGELLDIDTLQPKGVKEPSVELPKFPDDAQIVIPIGVATRQQPQMWQGLPEEAKPDVPAAVVEQRARNELAAQEEVKSAEVAEEAKPAIIAELVSTPAPEPVVPPKAMSNASKPNAWGQRKVKR